MTENVLLSFSLSNVQRLNLKNFISQDISTLISTHITGWVDVINRRKTAHNRRQFITRVELDVTLGVNLNGIQVEK